MDPVVQQEVFNAEVGQVTAPATISNTASGILVGVDAPSAPQATIGKVTNVEEVTPMGRFTEDDLARIRQQEKDKLYPQIETLKETVARLEAERAERTKLQEDARAAEEADARTRAESQMDVRELLAQKEQEWQQRLEDERLERERAFALLEQERSFQALEEFRRQRVEAESNAIMPELLDLVQGSTTEEIESSIESLKQRTARILESAQSALQAQRREQQGSRVTAPAAGIVDAYSGNQQLTPDAIRGMDMTEYMKNRDKLLGKSPTARGMFG